tara:strand:+ start:782 stop:1549 length:768 start_codon:yes stop_codon:yes gene_type:complete
MHKHFQLLEKIKQPLNLCALTLILVIFWAAIAYANDVNGDFSNNYQDSTLDSNNESTSETNNYNATGAGSPAPVMSSIAPTVMGAGGNDSCLMPTSVGIQLSLIGISGGTMAQDPNCNRRKDARLLGTPQQIGGLGLQVSAISVLCDSPEVFKAMVLAATPCPIVDVLTSKILMGKKAISKYREDPNSFIVGYVDNKSFWDNLLRIGEDLTNEIDDAQVNINVGDTRSLSERFRSTRAGLRSDGGTEDNGTQGDD